MELAEAMGNLSYVIKVNGLQCNSEESTKHFKTLEKEIFELEWKKKHFDFVNIIFYVLFLIVDFVQFDC